LNERKQGHTFLPAISNGFLKRNRALAWLFNSKHNNPRYRKSLGKGRLSLIENLMLRKLERERFEQEARRVASHPAESEVLPEPAGSALATSAGSVVPLPASAGSAMASTGESSLDPRRRERFPTEWETALDLSNEEEEVVESLSVFAPLQQEWPAARGEPSPSSDTSGNGCNFGHSS
jgi:hypothetical protein